MSTYIWMKGTLSEMYATLLKQSEAEKSAPIGTMVMRHCCQLIEELISSISINEVKLAISRVAIVAKTR